MDLLYLRWGSDTFLEETNVHVVVLAEYPSTVQNTRVGEQPCRSLIFYHAVWAALGIHWDHMCCLNAAWNNLVVLFACVSLFFLFVCAGVLVELFVLAVWLAVSGWRAG